MTQENMIPTVLLVSAGDVLDINFSSAMARAFAARQVSPSEPQMIFTF